MKFASETGIEGTRSECSGIVAFALGSVFATESSVAVFHVIPPGVEPGAAPLADGQQEPELLAAHRVGGQPARVAQGRVIPIQFGTAFLVAVQDVRLPALVA